MSRRVTIICVVLAIGSAPGARAAAQSAPAACASAADCRAETEAAITQGEFERAHDLAWRAMQKGPRNDSGLMYLLARAQALSGRPDDALVMLRRLAEIGVAVDASTDEFRRTRDLDGWPDVETLIARATAPTAASSATPPSKSESLLPSRPIRTGRRPLAPLAAPAVSVAAGTRAPTAPTAPAAPPESAESVEPLSINPAGSFSSVDFAPGGLACDAVSRRFVFGDRPGRKLRIVAEGADNAIDLTREASAGFLEVMALDIDTSRGDLWVASAAPDGSAATLHKLQLISGRVLKSYDMAGDFGSARPIDLAVTASGAVLVLDASRGRVLVLRPGAGALEVLAPVQEAAPASLAVGNREGTAYIAHQDGISRLDLRTRAVTLLGRPAAVNLGGIEHLRRAGSQLIGVQAMPGGSRRLVRIALDTAGLVVTRVQVIAVSVPAAGVPVLAAVCDDTLAVMSLAPSETAGRPASHWTFRQIRLAPLTRLR